MFSLREVGDLMIVVVFNQIKKFVDYSMQCLRIVLCLFIYLYRRYYL